MDIQKLTETVEELLAPGKGILAADESSGTIKRRFDSINVESTEENRRDYREMLFRAPGVSEYISGVILFDETLRQNGADGTPLCFLDKWRNEPHAWIKLWKHHAAQPQADLINEVAEARGEAPGTTER